MKDERDGKLYAVKCFTKEQEGRAEAYRQITEELKDVSSPYLTSVCYFDKDLFVDTDQTSETEFPVLLMDWVEGKTLDKYLRENLDDRYALEMLAYRFSQLTQWLIPQSFAHGDLKPENILVREDGTLVLVDYDGMYVPAMKGQKARELGSPDFRHPQRTENDFDEHIDDFPLVSILLSLKAISLNPQLIDEYGTIDRLLLSEVDYQNINKCDVIKHIFPSEDNELNRICSAFIIILSSYRTVTIPTELYSCHISLKCLEHFFDLGEKYKKGINAEQNGELSVRYYKIAAKLGFTKAQYKLGVCYRDGFGVEIDINKALLWFNKAADQGDIFAKHNIGCIKSTNNPLEISVFADIVKQAGILLSVNKDDIEAMSILGICLIYGNGVEKNEEKGFSYLRQAAEKGDSNAQAYVGFCYYRGKGVEKNKEEAVKWFEISANQGNSSSQRALGRYYLGTDDIEDNKKLAVNWLKKAANQGDSISQRLLGICYAKGEGVKRDYNMAFRCFVESAKRGDKRGGTLLAYFYECGYGTIVNKDKARYWYEKSAEKGEPYAQEALERIK